MGSSYEAQLSEKNEHVKKLLTDAGVSEAVYEGIKESPLIFGYRNKMEYSFGDCVKNGPLTLGLHQKKSFYNVIDVDCCRLVHDDVNVTVRYAADFFRKLGITYADKRSHLGYLRHMLIRRTVNTEELLIDLVTTSQPLIGVENHSRIYEKTLYDSISADFKDVRPAAEVRSVSLAEALKTGVGAQQMNAAQQPVSGSAAEETLKEAAQNPQNCVGSGTDAQPDISAFPCRYDEAEVLEAFKEGLLDLKKNGIIKGSIAGILHTVNDQLADAVKNDRTDVLYGSEFITEKMMGLKFSISPFSFFQTNTRSAEVIYSTAGEYISSALSKDAVLYDLYSGTGTIAQMLSPYVKKAIGVEIVEEAVEAAGVNAVKNNIKNCEFIAGDVLKELDNIAEKPDVIVLDPPREGINPKALRKILDYGVKRIIYISCKPESLARDLEMFFGYGYKVERAAAVDQFPWTKHVECVVLMSRVEK